MKTYKYEFSHQSNLIQIGNPLQNLALTVDTAMSQVIQDVAMRIDRGYQRFFENLTINCFQTPFG